MKNRNNRTGKYEHDWGFMANSKKGDLLQCQHDGCRVWSFMGEKPYFELSHDEFVGMHNRGEIDAFEALGDRTNNGFSLSYSRDPGEEPIRSH